MPQSQARHLHLEQLRQPAPCGGTVPSVARLPPRVGVAGLQSVVGARLCPTVARWVYLLFVGPSVICGVLWCRYATYGPFMGHPCSMRIVRLHEPYVHGPVAIIADAHPSFSPHPLLHNCTGSCLTRTAKRSTGLQVTSESAARQRYVGEATTRRTTVLVTVTVPWRLAAPVASRCTLLPSFWLCMTAYVGSLCGCLLTSHTPLFVMVSRVRQPKSCT